MANRPRPHRKRRSIRSDHFELLVLRQPTPTAPVSVDKKVPGIAPAQAPILHMAVPKRLLKRAVDRNVVRRLVREYWRQANRVDGQDRSRTPTPLSSRALGQSSGTSDRGLGGHYLLKLKARPANFSEMSRPARKRYWHLELAILFGQFSKLGR